MASTSGDKRSTGGAGTGGVRPPGGGGKHPTVAQRHPHLSPVVSTGISMGSGQQVRVINLQYYKL